MSNAKSHIPEHFRQIIWYSLDNSLVNNALFVAERLLALNDRDPDSRHLLGICFLRAGRASSAYTATRGFRHPGCSYVFAQSCKEMGRFREGLIALENALSQSPKKWSACNWRWIPRLISDDHSDGMRNHLPDAGALLCLMGHLYRSSGDSKRAMDTYIEALKVNPYLWEAFDGLIELGTHAPTLPKLMWLGVSLRMENCFKANSTMRALREATHTTNIDVPLFQPGTFGSSLGDIPESSGSNATTAFQPIFNWGKAQPTFLSRFNQPATPG
jgi:anaphase-promoting complex subunit 3